MEIDPQDQENFNSIAYRTKNHFDYLERVCQDQLISQEVKERAKTIWLFLSDHFQEELPIPLACTGPDGEMFYSWNLGEHHLEMEILSNLEIEFFYRNRKTENYWGEDWDGVSPFPKTALKSLGLFRKTGSISK